MTQKLRYSPVFNKKQTKKEHLGINIYDRSF